MNEKIRLTVDALDRLVTGGGQKLIFSYLYGKSHINRTLDDISIYPMTSLGYDITDDNTLKIYLNKREISIFQIDSVKVTEEEDSITVDIMIEDGCMVSLFSITED